MLGIEQKKGLDKKLCGRMIAYAKILPSPDADVGDTPFDDMIKNGLLVLEGDFRQLGMAQPSRREMKRNVDAKLNKLLATMEENGVELPENLNVDALRDRLHELSNMEVIPIPARIGNFGTEEDILKEDADIYFIGEFIGMNQAHFCLTTLPIYYQAKYREQARRDEMNLLNEILSEFESSEFVDTDDLQKNSSELFPKGITLNNFVGDLSNLLNSRVIPFLLACESDRDYEVQIGLFYNFMKSYPEQDDIIRLDRALRELRKKSDSTFARQLLELGCKKICAVYDEESGLVHELDAKLKAFEQL